MMVRGDSPGIYRFDAFRLDPGSGAVLGADGAELRLRPKAYAMLRHLLDNPGRLLGREELLDALWPGLVVTDDSLTQCVVDLRRAFGDRAAQVLKTIPKRGYMLVAEVLRDDPPRPGVPSDLGPAPALPPDVATSRQNSVVVHRLETPGGDPACALLAETMLGDLVAELTQLPWLRVLPVTDAVVADGYRVRGEVRAAGAEFRITVRLEDAAGGAALWAERLDQPRDAPSGLPKAALVALVAHLNEQVRRHELSAARRKPLAALGARELTLIGRDHHQRGTEEDTRVAKEMFARAIAADPDFAPAYAWQAYTVHRAVIHGWGSPGGQAARDESLRLARRAVQIAPDSPLCLARLAFSLVLHQRWEEAVDAAREALGSGRPAFAAARNACCEVLTHAGHPEEAVAIAEGTLALDPLALPTTQAILGRALLLAGRAQEALSPLRTCASRLPDYVWTYDSLVVAAEESGRVPEALAARRELFRLKPGWVPRNHTGLWFFRRPEDLARFEAAHRRLAELAGVGGGEQAVAPATTPPSGTGPLVQSPAPPAPLPQIAGAQVLDGLRRHTLVVHPLRAAPDDGPAARAASLLTSDLVAELARYENLRVVAGAADGLEQNFGLKGDVHSAGEDLHAAIHLFDPATGMVVWGKRWTWPSDRATDLTAGSVETLASALDVQIGRETLRRARRKPVDGMTARELAYLGKDLFQHGNRADTEAARDLFVRASALDPDYAPAPAWHALTLTRAVAHGWDGPASEVTERAIRLARRAVEIEPESPFSLAALALALGTAGHWEGAVSAARLALRGERVAGEGARISIGEVLTAAGHPDEAEEVLRQTMARNAHGYPVAHAVLGRALLLRGRPEEAMGELRRCAAQLPDYALCFRTMVVAATEAGLVEEARGALRQLARLRPGWVQGTEPIFWFLRGKDDAERWQAAFEVALRLNAAARTGTLMDTPASRA